MQAEQARRDFLVSIRPTYAEKIIAGQKTVELRRRFPQTASPGAIALIYSSSPVQAIIGYAVVDHVQRLPIDSMWTRHGGAACITKDDFYEYFDGADEGFAIVIRKAEKFKQEICVSDLRERFGFVPPQSFRYLEKEYYALLDHEQHQATDRHKRRNRSRRR